MPWLGESSEMDKQLNPIVLIVVVIVVVIGLSLWGYHALQPAPYTPSPGVGGTPAVSSASLSQDGGYPETNPGAPPPGAIPGSAPSGTAGARQAHPGQP